MAIAAWDILTYNGSDWINQKWTQGPLGIGTNGAPSAQMQVNGTSDEIQLLVKGNSTQTNSLVSIQKNDGTILSSVGNLGQTSLTYPDSTNTLQYPLRLNRQGSGTPSSGFGLGIQFYGWNSTPTFVEIADIQVYQTAFNATHESAYLNFVTLTNGAGTQGMFIIAGSVVVGTGAVLSTGATDGFLYVPTMNGNPTGTPTAYTGAAPMVFDTSSNKLWVYHSGWKGVVLS